MAEMSRRKMCFFIFRWLPLESAMHSRFLQNLRHSQWSRPLVTVTGWGLRVFCSQIWATPDVWSFTCVCCASWVQRHETLYWSMTAFVICNKTQEISTETGKREIFKHLTLSSDFILQLHLCIFATTKRMHAPSEMCREVREEDVESW